MKRNADLAADRTVLRLQSIFTERDLDRVTVKKDSGNLDLYVDLHEMKATEAKRFASNLVALVADPCRIFFIHGYNHGTVLKRIITQDLQSKKISSKHVLESNPGVTSVSVNVA